MKSSLYNCANPEFETSGARQVILPVYLVVRFQIKIANLAIGSNRFANLLTFIWEVVLKATSHAAIFRVCKYAINETDDVYTSNYMVCRAITD